MEKAIICDLDGTLCLMGNRNPYDASQCELDTPCNVVMSIIESLGIYHDCNIGDYVSDHHIIFVSGREHKYRNETLRWLTRYLSPHLKFKLYMRGTDDKRKDFIVKEEIYENHIKNKYEVNFAIDDRNQVVDMWRSKGLVCLQVRPGNF